MVDQAIAVLSDIHGNSWALQSVLEDIEQRGIHKIVNLGDSFYGPLDPQGTAKMLLDRKFMSVQGNEDRILVTASKRGLKHPSLDFTKKTLNSDAIAWLRKLTSTAIVGKEIFLCHGSPERDDEYLLEEVSEQWVVLRSTAAIAKMITGIDQQLILCGHSHLPRIVGLPTGQLIVNPGSVGLPAYMDEQPYLHCMETGSPHSRYSILSKNITSWHIENVAIPYDWQTAAATALKNGRPDWAKWIAEGRA
ncbi:MAG: metallophosphoesterase family protein [Candidatus Hodarchaeales archaeon]|jgi:predicted phosphodiesterase